MTRTREEADRMVETVRKHASSEPDPIQAKMEADRVAYEHDRLFPKQVWIDYPDDPTGEGYAFVFKDEPLPIIEDSVPYVRKDVVDELVEALWLASEFIDEFTGSCPMDSLDHEFPDCNDICEKIPTSDCWHRYFMEKAAGFRVQKIRRGRG